MDCSLPTGRPVLTRSASTFSPASLSLSERSTDTLVLSQPSKKRLSISWTLQRDGGSVVTGRPVLTIWFGVFGWVCWELSSCPATSEPNSIVWTQFLHPIVFKGNLQRRPRWLTYSLVFDLSSFHLDSLRDTIGWECIVKDDGVRSRLIEL